VQKIRDGSYKWDASIQAFVLASFYYGYITTTLVGGILALKFGGKALLLIAVAWTSVLSIVTPPLTIVGDAAAMITVRVLEGVGQVSYMHRQYSVVTCDLFHRHHHHKHIYCACYLGEQRTDVQQ